MGTTRSHFKRQNSFARAAIRSISDADTRNSLSKIKQPTLVIAGEEDLVTPTRESEILAKGISSKHLINYSKGRSFLDA